MTKSELINAMAEKAGTSKADAKRFLDAFTGTVTEGQDRVRAGDDAAEARWFNIAKLPENLAFDHEEMIRAGVERLGWTGMYS